MQCNFRELHDYLQQISSDIESGNIDIKSDNADEELSDAIKNILLRHDFEKPHTSECAIIIL